MRRLALALLLLLAFTLGGVNPPAAQDDTSNLALWLVQAQCPNGGPPWSCPGATLSRTSFSSPLWFAKEDAYGQRVTSVISDDGIQKFNLKWPLYNSKTTACSKGWTWLDPQTISCHTTVWLPYSGYGLGWTAIDAIVNDHYGGPGLTGDAERHVMGANVGFAAYYAYNTIYPAWPGAPSIVYGLPPNPPTKPLANWRLPFNFMSQIPSVAAFGWPPGGKLP